MKKAAKKHKKPTAAANEPIFESSARQTDKMDTKLTFPRLCSMIRSIDEWCEEVRRRALALKRWQGHPPIHSAEQLAITRGRTAPEEGKQWGDGFSEPSFDGNVSSALNAALAASEDTLKVAADRWKWPPW